VIRIRRNNLDPFALTVSSQFHPTRHKNETSTPALQHSPQAETLGILEKKEEEEED